MILAIDPGNEFSAYVCMNDDFTIKEGDKLENKDMLDTLEVFLNYGTNKKVAIEMVACYGMAVGKTVFETCVFIGQLKEMCRVFDIEPTFIYRKDEKMTLCHSMKAKDANIRQALIDKYAKFDFKNGKGTKANPDTFYGFKADMWAAMAVAHAYKELYLERSAINE